ncbi:hypothetical protein [Thermococcus sp. JCM 11816]|uniref:hypothetical protein n=1 Tax=Thermococcus sp. (strain JCM 11816 / KS-1) TaxID=1295125 RepID=UPI00346571AE
MANRYFFVADPIPMYVEGAQEFTAEIPLHPDYPERGGVRSSSLSRISLSTSQRTTWICSSPGTSSASRISSTLKSWK